jgi:hypothetical protein
MPETTTSSMRACHNSSPSSLPLSSSCTAKVEYVHTLNTISLSQLRTIHQQIRINMLPVLALRQSQVDMSGRQLINVEPDVFVETVFD